MGYPHEDSKGLLVLLLLCWTGPGHFARSEDLFDKGELGRAGEGMGVNIEQSLCHAKKKRDGGLMRLHVCDLQPWPLLRKLTLWQVNEPCT